MASLYRKESKSLFGSKCVVGPKRFLDYYSVPVPWAQRGADRDNACLIYGGLNGREFGEPGFHSGRAKLI